MHHFSFRVRRGRGKHLLFGLAMVVSWFVAGSWALAQTADNEPPPGFIALFNGKDLTGWKVPEGDGGHWKVVDGVDRLRRPERGQGRQEPVDRARVRRLRIARRLAAQGSAVHQQERSLHPARRHPREGHPRQGDEASPCPTPIRASSCGARAITRSTSGAGPSGRARCTAVAPTQVAARTAGRRHAPDRRPTTRSASGITSRSPSEAKQSRSS